MLKSELIREIAKTLRPKLFDIDSTPGQQREILIRVNQFLEAAVQCGLEFPGGITNDDPPKKEKVCEKEERLEIKSNLLRTQFFERRKTLKLSLVQLAARLDINLRTLESFERRHAAPDETAFNKISEWVQG